MKSLFIATPLALTLLCLVRAEYDIEPLTYDTQLWSSKPKDLAAAFPALEWQVSENKASSLKEGLKLWDKPVESLSILSGETGTNCNLELTLLSEDTAQHTEVESFVLLASGWKQALDKNIGTVAKRLPSIKEGPITTSKMIWKTEHSIIVLSAQQSDKPRSLKVSIFETKTGLASLTNENKQEQKATEDPAKKDKQGEKGTVLAALEGRTSYLAQTTFKNKPIPNIPEYFLLYYSASW